MSTNGNRTLLPPFQFSESSDRGINNNHDINNDGTPTVDIKARIVKDKKERKESSPERTERRFKKEPELKPNGAKMISFFEYANLWLGHEAKEEEKQSLARAIAYGDSLGVSAPVAIHNIQILGSKVVISPELLRGLILDHPELEKTNFQADEKYSFIRLQRRGIISEATFKFEDAQILGCHNRITWKRDSIQMLVNRTLFMVARQAFPEIILTAISPDELEDEKMHEKTTIKPTSLLNRVKAFLFKLLTPQQQ